MSRQRIALLLAVSCIARAFAFAPPPLYRLKDHLLPVHSLVSLVPSQARTFLRASDLSTDSGATYGLHFSEEEGSLYVNCSQKICLLTGLSPSHWSASSGNSNGIVLQSSHPTEESAFDTSLGKLSTCHRFLACSRLTRYWMGPAFGSLCKDIPTDTQFLLLEVVKGGPYALFLPMLDGNFRASLYGDRNGDLICHQESGDKSTISSGTKALYCSVGNDPFQLLKEGFQSVSKEMKTFATLDTKKLPSFVDDFAWCTWDAFYSEVTPQGVIDGVKSLREVGIQPKTIILDDGWQQVEPKKKTSLPDKGNGGKAASLASKLANAILGVLSNVVSKLYERFVRTAQHNSFPNRLWRLLTRTVLKGQMWGYFDDETDFARQLSDFDSNEKFQDSDDGTSISLKGLVKKLKTELGVTRLFCWHALHGYWRGVAPKLGTSNGINVTDMIPELSEHLLQVDPVLAWDAVALFGVGLCTDEKDLMKLYDLLHEPLVAAGVDGVKVDVQSGVASLGGGTGGGSRIARMYTNALEESVSTRFTSLDGASSCINCMCHSTENLYHYKQTSVARASDDFYPRRPNSHTVHLVNVAYNSLFIGEVCLPDWDMFHSKHESGALHAAARAISGGPVYVSDAPGEHDATLLKRLVLKDGTVLRCMRPGRPTRDCLFADVGKDASTVLKIWNENKYCGVLGLFNIQGVTWNFKTHENDVVNKSPPTLKVLTRPYDVESLRSVTGPFVAYNQRSERLTFLADGETEVENVISPREWDIITICPVQERVINCGDSIAWAPIGLVDMLNSGGAVDDVSNFTVSGDSSSSVEKYVSKFTCRGPGRFVAYCQPEPSQVSLADKPRNPTSLPFSYDARKGALSFVLPSEKEGKAHRITVAWG